MAKGKTDMTKNLVWTRLGLPAVFVLVLAAGGAAAQEGGRSDLPDGFCDDCEESGDFEGEVLSKGPSGAGTTAGTRSTDSSREEPDEWRFGRSPPSSNACFVPELYVAWLCEGYPQP